MAASFASLPAEVVEHIAYQSALLHPHSPPSTLVALAACNKGLYNLLDRRRNARLYARLFRNRFDVDALERRFGASANGRLLAGVESQRSGKTGASKGKSRERSGTGSREKSVPRHEGSLVLTSAASSTASQSFAAASFPSALNSPSDAPDESTATSATLPGGEPSDRTEEDEAGEEVPTIRAAQGGLTVRHLADAFVERVEFLKRVRNVGRVEDETKHLRDEEGQDPRSPLDIVYGDEDEDEEGEGQTMGQLTKDMWTAYLMVLENDGRNVEQLVSFGKIRDFLKVFYKDKMLAAAVKPGYPPETPERTLYMHVSHALLDFDELSAEDPSENDARFFVLKPYVFAAHTFDAFFAPWTFRNLPIPPPGAEDPRSAAPEVPLPPRQPQPGDDAPAIVDAAFVANLTPRVRGQTLPYLGRTVHIAPPILSHAACRTFFLRVEREPEQNNEGNAAAMRPQSQVNPPATAMAEHAVGTTTLADGTRTSIPTIAAEGSSTSRAGMSYTELSCDAVALSSTDHDKDYVRLTSCLDPYSSPGLPSLFHLGDFPGAWEGRFSFFDFDSYRDMLSGRMLSLYQGPFGDQPQVWKLEERIRRTRDGKLVRGAGKAMGVRLHDGRGVKEALARVARADAEASAAANEGGMNWDEVGRASAAAKAGSSGAAGNEEGKQGRVGDDEDEELDPDEDYEIELQGTGHSAWGQFILQGRIRAWDGMFTLTKEYTPDGRGRWLYRGYLVAGGLLVGRWRDTFTPEHLSGYEGTFLMRKR